MNSEPTASINPRGLFDRSAKGKSTDPVTVQVERGRIRLFAQILECTDPLHFDIDAAKSAGHPDLVAPPSFFMVIEALANEERDRLGKVNALQLVGCDYRYLLHGDERYVYNAPIFAGEDVEVTSTVVDFYDKKGGAMEFVTFESTISHAERGVLLSARRTLLHRLPDRNN